jgi:chromosomal replication initiator protein
MGGKVERTVGDAAGRDEVGAGELWQRALARLSTRLNGHVFQSWFRPVRAVGLLDGELTLGVPSLFHLDWVRDHYMHILEEELVRDLPGCRVRLSVVPDLEVPGTAQASSFATPPFSIPPFPTPHRPARSRAPSSLNAAYTFGNYVCGPSNQFATAACQAVGQKPGGSYNPLFLFGGVGLGKTHLLHAIGNKVCEEHPDWNVAYLSAEHFTNDLINSLQQQKMDQFRARYRAHCDVLLIDDIQFIAGKDRTQEEFFHSFNHLHAAGRQVVVTSDKFPHEMEGLEERLRTRLQWGLIADIQPPEMETRMAILRTKAAQHGVSILDDVAAFLATYIKNNVRELEGSLVRLIAASSIKRRPLDLALAREELRDQVLRSAKLITCSDIQKHVSSYYNLNMAELRGSKRTRNITLPRQLAMYLCRKHTHASFPEIGSAFGGKDHTTVMASVRKIEGLIKVQPDVAQVVEQLGKILDNG